MPKSSTRDLALIVEQDIGRLEVTMDDQLPMRVIQRAGDLDNQIHALLDAQPLPGTGLVDRVAIDELHRQPRPAIGRGAGVDQPRQPRIIQTGEDLRLLKEAAAQLLTAHAQRH